MHFHHLLRWCHEAWEESLERFGIPAADIFPGCRAPHKRATIALPVVHCSAHFLHPVHGGDHLNVILEPSRLDPTQYEVHFLFRVDETIVARGSMKQLAINPETRRRCALPEAIDRWLEASAIGTIGTI